MSEKLVNSEPLERSKFKNPSRELGILPFWFWNGDLRYDEMEWQLKEYYDKGMPGFFIHSRFGLQVDYLSKEWFDRVKFVCEKAEEIGIEAWIYDEKNWPSGTAGWEVPRQYPDLQQRYVQMAILSVKGPFFTYLEGTDSRYIDLEKSEPVAAYAVRAEEFDGEIKEIIDLTPNICFEKIISWEAPPGEWKILYFIERRADYYIDALNPESTRKFIEMTHEKYKERVGKYFGNVVPGFYTDEPALHYFETGVDNYIIPWSKNMFKLFRQRNGYGLRKYLPALFLNMGEKTSKVRLDFWQTVSEQYTKAYYKQLADWCHDNGLLFTGHLLFEDMLRLHARNEGNIFDHLKNLDIVGVDHLYPRIGTREMPEQHVPSKIGSSAAHHFGSTRVLCESLGGTHWDVTMERMKWIADWEYVLGINLFNPHGFHYSIEGERKRDWPPSQFYHHTWWKHYKRFNDYLTRNSYMLSGGKHVAKIALLYPINSMWANYQPQGHNQLSELIENDFYYLTDTLLRLHFDFDYIDEKVLAEGVIENGKLKIADEEYELIIMPGITNISFPALEKIADFYHSGGKIIADAILPTESLSGGDEAVIKIMKDIFGIDPVAVREKFLSGDENKEIYRNLNHSGGKAILMRSVGLHKVSSPEWLDSTLRECITPDVEIDDSEVFYLHRIKDGHDIYFFVNPTNEPRKINCNLERKGRPERWISETGEIEPLFIFKVNDGHTEFPLELAPYESALIVLQKDIPELMVIESNVKIEEVTTDTITAYSRGVEEIKILVSSKDGFQELNVLAREDRDIIKLSGPWKFRIEGSNALLLNSWKVNIDTERQGDKDKYYSVGLDDSKWLDFTQGIWEMQLPEERDEKTYPVTLWYRSTFECEYIPEDLRIIIDGIKGDKEIYLNEVKLDTEEKRSEFDAMMRELDIARAVKKGRNQITIRLVVNKFDDGILDPLRIVGHFSLRKNKAGDYLISQPVSSVENGSLTEQGYPYFSGVAVLEKEFTIDESPIEDKLKLVANCGDDLLEVIINGRQVGLCTWHPYVLDIGDYVQPGENKITLKITNTLVNFLEGKDKAYGLFDEVRLVPYHCYKFDIKGL